MLRGRGGSERGSVAITVALTMTVLLGFAALVVDIGLNWATRTSAQTAADSAALAGASRLLLDGGVAAIATVETILNDNVDDLVDLPAAAGWATDGNEANGEVVCWLLTDPQPGAGAGCPDEANALQVITPPIEVQYAFAPLLGQSSRNIKARAAAGAGPAAPNNCVLCLLEPVEEEALLLLGPGGVRVAGGGIVVNSNNSLEALVLATTGNISADQIRVVGGVDVSGGGLLLPAAEVGGPPVPDPLAGLPPPNLLIPAPAPATTPVQDVTGAVTLAPGVYESINVNGGATLTLEEGVYVVTEDPGFRVENGGRVVGGGATIYLACQDYPTPCDGDGTRFRLDNGGQFQAAPPVTGQYAGLSIFADRGNTRSTQLFGGLHLTGAVYTASSQLRLSPTANVRVDNLVVVDRLRSTSLALFRVNYNPILPPLGVGVPVLIR